MVTWLTFINRHGLWLSWPLFGLGVVLVWFGIMTVVRLSERHRLCRLPLAPEQVVEFDEARRVILWFEGPLLSARSAGLSFGLTATNGQAVEGNSPWFPLRPSTFSTVRTTKRCFEIPAPGRYILKIEGLGATKPSDENHQLVFMRPYLAQSIGCVLVIILGGFLGIGSLVNFLLRLSQRPG